MRSVAAGTVYRRADYGSPMPALSAVRIRVKATSALFRFKFYAKAILRSAFHMKARNLKTKWQKLSKSRLK